MLMVYVKNVRRKESFYINDCIAFWYERIVVRRVLGSGMGLCDDDVCGWVWDSGWDWVRFFSRFSYLEMWVKSFFVH